MARILAIADEVDESLYGDKLRRLRPDIIVSCGDLPYGYLDNLVSRANVPLVYVPGNHDPDLTTARWLARPYDEPSGPPGGENADGQLGNPETGRPRAMVAVSRLGDHSAARPRR